MAKSIVITGYPYAYPHYFKVFEYVENKKDLIFILPKYWEAKGGKVKINLKDNSDFKTYGLSALSFGGKSLFGGLFKGWLPAICFTLFHIRLKWGSGVVYSCLEPNLLSTLYNAFWAKVFGFKHVFFTWQNIPPEDRMSGLKLKLSNTLVKLNLAFSDGVICGNKKAETIIKRFKFPQAVRQRRGRQVSPASPSEVGRASFKFLVCPLSGVDTEKFKPNRHEIRGNPPGVVDGFKYVLFYGALEKRKGVDVLINTMLKLYNIKLELKIIGTGPEKEDLKQQVGNNSNITFLDWVNNEKLPEYLNAADVFVYPSRRLGGWEEQFGYAMAEASACGLPVVATRTGSIDEVVIDNESGILVEPDNSEQLAEAINKILSDKELADQMGRFGREHIVKNYSHSVVANKLILFLEQF